jgi:hypothetical protein
MKFRRTEIKWALIFTLMGLIWMALERAFGLHDSNIHLHPYLTNLIAIPAILVYVLFLREKRDVDFTGEITYKQSFISGLIMTLFVTMLVPLNQWITLDYITPHFFENVIKYSVDNELMSLKDAKAYFNFENYLIQSVVFAPVMGLVTTSIVSRFIKSKKSA